MIECFDVCNLVFLFVCNESNYLLPQWTLNGYSKLYQSLITSPIQLNFDNNSFIMTVLNIFCLWDHLGRLNHDDRQENINLNNSTLRRSFHLLGVTETTII